MTTEWSPKARARERSAGWWYTLRSEHAAHGAPQFLAIGHVSKDVHDEGFALGGTVTYAGLQALRLGLRTAIVTACAADLPIAESVQGARISIRHSEYSTTFQNVYAGSQREQHIRGVAEPLDLSDVPPSWRRSPIVLLGPVAGELSPDLFSAFPDSLLALTPQGMLRAWDDDGRVYPITWPRAERLLKDVDVLVLSEDDLSDSAELQRYVALVDIVAVTHSERGATVYDRGVASRFPAYPCDATEPTGAGDVFAAAFIIELDATGDVAQAAPFGNCAASFVIEGKGASNMPTRVQIEERMSATAELT